MTALREAPKTPTPGTVRAVSGGQDVDGKINKTNSNPSRSDAQSKKIVRKTEIVTDGTRHLGRINIKPEGCETYGPADQYLGKFLTVGEARKALFRMSQAGQTGQGGESSGEQ